MSSPFALCRAVRFRDGDLLNASRQPAVVHTVNPSSSRVESINLPHTTHDLHARPAGWPSVRSVVQTPTSVALHYNEAGRRRADLGWDDRTVVVVVVVVTNESAKTSERSAVMFQHADENASLTGWEYINISPIHTRAGGRAHSRRSAAIFIALIVTAGHCYFGTTHSCKKNRVFFCSVDR